MPLSMMVVITSWAPVRAFNTPGMAPNIAPPTPAANSANGTCSTAGSWNANPTHKPVIAPANICPVAPMLKRPALNADETAKPAKSNGVAPVMVLEMARSEPNEPLNSPQ